MAKIANTELTDTFDSWRNATNAVRHRMNAFAVNESAFYANTITANVTFKTNYIEAGPSTGVLNINAASSTFTGNVISTSDMVRFTSTNLELKGQTRSYNLVPFDDATRSLGNVDYTWDELHIGRIFGKSGVFVGNSVNFDTGRIVSTANNTFGGTNTNISSTLLVTGDTKHQGPTTIATDQYLYMDSASTSYLRHDNTGTFYFHHENGPLRIRANTFSINSTDGVKRYLTALTNAGIVLYYNDVEKVRTADHGLTISGNTTMADNYQSHYGTSTDLSVYHDGSNSYIANKAGSGNLYVKGSDVYLQDSDGTNLLRAADNAGVTLYHNGSTKLATTSAGASVTGSLAVSTSATVGGTLSYASANGAVHTNTSVSGTVIPNFGAYTHFVWNLTGNIVLGNPTTENVGQTGCFVFTHIGGARTVSLGSEYDAPSGTLSLSTVTGYVDIVPYIVSAPNKILLGTSTKNLL
jgi:hypothetical protein